MKATVVHAIPGRLRLKVSNPFELRVARIAGQAKRIGATIEPRPFAKSIIIRYDPKKVPERVIKKTFGTVSASPPVRWQKALAKILPLLLFEGVLAELAVGLFFSLAGDD